MKVLTVRQPWAWAIVHGGKDVENRVRNIAGTYRGPIAIHVSKSNARGIESDSPLRAAMGDWYLNHDTGHDEIEPWNQHHGQIIGVVDLLDVHKPAECWERGYAEVFKLYHEDRPAFDALPDSGAGGIIGKIRRCSNWAEDPGDRMHHLVLANPRPLAAPIPFPGALGLRRLDPATITHITAVLAAEATA